MKKGTIVSYKCNGKTVNSNGKEIDLFQNSEFLEVVTWNRFTPFVTIRGIGSKEKGVKVRKDYLTEIKE